MKEVDVLILFEHKSREFESACLLKYELEKCGLSVTIESTFPNREMLPIIYKVKYLFTPWYYTGTKYIANFLKNSPDAIIINMHHEQYTIENSDILIPRGDARFVYHLAWGTAFKEQLLSVKCTEDLIINCGNIRLDIFKGKLQNLFPSKNELSIEFGMDGSKKWCLFIADSSHLLESYQLEDDSLGKYKDVFIASKNSREVYLKYIDNLLKINKDIIFIYRPHPCMANKDLNSEDLVEMMKKYPDNFFAIYKYPLNCWLINSDICFSFISSSLIESYFAKTEYYLFRSEEISKEVDYTFFHDFRYLVNDYNSFIKSLNSNTYNFKYIADKLGYWYNMSEEYTFRKIVNSILKIKNHKNIIKYNKINWYHNMLEAYIKEFIIQLGKISFVKKTLIRLNDNRINRILGDTDDIINRNEVDSFIQKLKEIEL